MHEKSSVIKQSYVHVRSSINQSSYKDGEKTDHQQNVA